MIHKAYPELSKWLHAPCASLRDFFCDLLVCPNMCNSTLTKKEGATFAGEKKNLLQSPLSPFFLTSKKDHISLQPNIVSGEYDGPLYSVFVYTCVSLHMILAI